MSHVTLEGEANHLRKTFYHRLLTSIQQLGDFST